MKTKFIVKRFVYLALILVALMKSYAQDKLDFVFQDFEVFKNQKTNTFKILDGEKIVYNKLKFVGYAENDLQVLDHNNKIFYLDYQLKIISFPEKVETLYCGTVDDFIVEIVDRDTHYLIEKTINPITSNQPTITKIIDSIPKNDINNIYFLNQKRNIQYDANLFFPETLIIKNSKDKTGIRSNRITQYFDEVNFKNAYALKVRKSKFYGYYGITKVKYVTLGEFVFNLANFELENGKKGYIDFQGNEYYLTSM